MNDWPDRANLGYLKKQAKDLIRLYRDRNPQAIAQFRHALPAAEGRSDEEIAALELRLHDAQSCVARSYGFVSWADLRSYVQVQSASRNDHAARALHWLRLVYSGDVDGRGIYDNVSEARTSLGRYLDFYNARRPHSSLDGTTPDQAYFTPLPFRLAA